MKNNDSVIKTLEITRRTFAEAEQDKAGPYKLEFVSGSLSEEKPLPEKLRDCEEEIVSYIRGMGFDFKLDGLDMVFDQKLGENLNHPNENNPAFIAYRLGFMVRDLRKFRLLIEKEDTLTMEQAEVLFRLGREIEAGWVMIFNKAAQTSFKQQKKHLLRGTWKKICQVGNEEEKAWLERGERPKKARGAALAKIQEQFSIPQPTKKTAGDQYKQWREENPEKLHPKSL